nr:RecName: Full=Hemocyanin subunit 1 [Maja squinado]
DQPGDVKTHKQYDVNYLFFKI